MACAIVWFRRDLRLADNPALAGACATCEQVIPVYIDAPEEEGEIRPGPAADWWLHHSLSSLAASLRTRGSRLLVRRGPSLDALRQLARETGATRVFWNRRYEPALIARDHQVDQVLRAGGIAVTSSNAALLFEPWQVTRSDGRPYRVFTPFWRACLAAGLPSNGPPAPAALPPVPGGIQSLEPGDLGLLPRIPWDAGLRATWEVGEGAAASKLGRFLDRALHNYHIDRDRPDLAGTSRLSPHLRCGEIGPRQMVAAVKACAANQPPGAPGIKAFLAEIGWREFAYHALHHYPYSLDAPLDERFAAFAWAEHYAEHLAAWQGGRTGIPMVDAGMRELWRTGWMHNRVRMTVASFLTKNLLIPWQKGANWFLDTLVDADLASNTLGWQWTAGCGLDAAPYFRIFNPVLQGKRFDPEGAYVRRFIPEIAALPDNFLHRPWTAPGGVLRESGIALGQDYPFPVVDLKATRERALARFEDLRRA